MHALVAFIAGFFFLTPSPLVQQTQQLRTKSIVFPCKASSVALPELTGGDKNTTTTTNYFPCTHALPLPRWDKVHHTIDKAYYVAHKAPVSTYLIIISPAIASFVLVQGWKGEESLQQLTNAVQTVLQKNPVLTGRATCPHNWWKHPEINILPGWFPPDKHPFVETIDLRYKLRHRTSLDNLSTQEQLKYIDKHVAPHVGRHDTTLQQIHKQSPLFGVKVVLLPNDYACVYTRMSHCIGDLVTYYMVMDQISSADRGGELRPIHWDNPRKAVHEIFPEELSKRDIQRLYGIPFILGVGTHVPTMWLRKQKYLLLDDTKIKEQKAYYKQVKKLDGITTNDIITSALCDACRSTDVFAMTRSMRGVAPGIGLRDGGNLHCEVPFHRVAGRNPIVVQDIVDKGRYFELGEVPLFESLMGKVGRISNCVAPISRMSFGGLKPVLYCPSKAFLDDTPLDTAIIFRTKNGETAVLHNFQKMVPSKQLEAILLAEKK